MTKGIQKMSQHTLFPRIGVGICIIKEDKILLGKRLNSTGAGSWAFPGGHLEFGESVAECAARETMEETGLVISNIRFVSIEEDFFKEHNKHYVVLMMAADWVQGQAQLMEPDKCEQWQWFSWDNLPSLLMRVLKRLPAMKNSYLQKNDHSLVR
jgi:8-oxo-dGTP diphosphatase